MAVNEIGLIIFVIGIALIIAEAFTPGAFIVVPGIALVIVGVLIMAMPDLTTTIWTPIIFLVSFIPAFLAAFFMYKRMAPPGTPTTMSSDGLIGRIGLVTRDVSPGNIRGKVMIEQETWSATADQTIQEGTKVRVEKVQGVKVIVRPFVKKGFDSWEETTLEVEDDT